LADLAGRTSRDQLWDLVVTEVEPATARAVVFAAAEIAARLLQGGERIFEVPVHYKARGSDEGKKLTAMDGLRVVATLFRCRFTRR
jgi:hypothetical protein